MLGFDVTGPYEPTGISESTREPQADLHLLRRRARPRRAALRRAHSEQSRAARVPPNGHRGGHRAAARFLSRGRRERRIRGRHSEGPARDSLEHEIPLPSRARRPAARRGARRRVRRHGSRARVAVGVLHLEPRPRRRVAGARREQSLERAEGVCAADRPLARRSAVEVARHELRVPMAQRARHRRHRSRPEAVPELRRRLAARRSRARWSCSLDSILRDDSRSVVELLTAPYTFVNERLARHYGIPGVLGDRFRRVELDDPNRWGLFGKGSICWRRRTRIARRPCCAARGSWSTCSAYRRLRRRPASRRTSRPRTERRRSVRERLALHRTQARLQPLPRRHRSARASARELQRDRRVARARARHGRRGRSERQLANGRPCRVPTDLREAIAGEPEKFVQTVAQNLMTYALGAASSITTCRPCASVVREAAESDYSFACDRQRRRQQHAVSDEDGAGAQPRRPWRPRSGRGCGD